MPMKKHPTAVRIQEILKRRETVTSDVADLDSNEQTVIAAIKAKQSELDQLDQKALLTPGALKGPLAEMATLQLQLSLIPGLRAKMKAEIGSLDDEIAVRCHELSVANLREVYEQLGVLGIRVREMLLPILIDEKHKIEEVVKTVVEASNLFRWSFAFQPAAGFRPTANSARALLLETERFLAGENR